MSGIGDVVGAWEAGNRRILWRDDGTFWWSNAWDAISHGEFQVESATLSLKHTANLADLGPDGDQCDMDKSGTYELSIAGPHLQFTAIEDPCAERVDFLAGDGDIEWESVPAPGPVASIEGLAGVWERQGGQYVQFNPEGTFTCALSRLNVEKAPDCTGQVSFEGEQLSVEVDQCPSDSVGVYQAERLDNGYVRFEAVKEDDCAWRVEFLVGPGSFETEFEPTR